MAKIAVITGAGGVLCSCFAKELAKDGTPSEKAVDLAYHSTKRDIAFADKELLSKQKDILSYGLEKKAQSPDTLQREYYEKFIILYFFKTNSSKF